MTTIANKLSVIPVIQQGVGICTVLSNAAKSIRDIALLINSKFFIYLAHKKYPDIDTIDYAEEFCGYYYLKINKEGKEQGLTPLEIEVKLKEESNKLCKNKELLSNEVKKFIETLKDSGKKEKYEMQLALNGFKNDKEAAKLALKEHVSYIGIGIIRCVPVVATVYSAAVWYKASHIKTN